MSMPKNLVFVRHGQSEMNLLLKSMSTDTSLYDDTVTFPDRSWRLTTKGTQQAKVIGEYLNQTTESFDTFYVSPYVRTLETAAHMQLKRALWKETRIIRERSWGEVNAIPTEQFKKLYPNNYKFQKIDPLYWTPPAGESIASVAENRVSNIIDKLHRDHPGENVICVTHHDFIWAARLVIENLTDDEFIELFTTTNIDNCSAIHYTRINPHTGQTESKINWFKIVKPVQKENGTWTVVESEWHKVHRRRLSNKQLNDKISAVERRFAEIETNKD